jgi:hypothetical protein
MSLPRLIHPVNTIIRQQNKAATPYDRDTREPIQRVAKSEDVQCPGQPKQDVANGGEDAVIYNEDGTTETALGYVLYRTFDLNARGITLKQGDEIVQSGHLTVSWHIGRLQWLGHYPDQNGPSLVRAWYTDRKPSRNREGV